MASLGTALETYLSGVAAITALTGNRIRPEVLDKSDAMPAITHNTISSFRDHGLDGISGVRHTRVQIDCYGATDDSAEAVYEQVRLAILALPRQTISSIFINSVEHENDYSATDAPTDGSENWRYLRIHEFIISHTEATP